MEQPTLATLMNRARHELACEGCSNRKWGRHDECTKCQGDGVNHAQIALLEALVERVEGMAK